ncbi:MAG: hypothetical protein ACK4ND_16070, partial [Cytophagaceae bacterium]
MFRITLFSFLLLLSSMAIGQDYPGTNYKNFEIPKQNIIKTSPLAMIQGPIIFTSEYRLAIERVLSRKISGQMGVSYLGKSNLFSIDAAIRSVSPQATNINVTTMGYRVQAALKYYLLKEAPYGLYFAPHLSYSYAEFFLRSHSHEVVKAHYKNLNFLFGYQFFIKKKIAFDMFAGYGVKENVFEMVDRTNVILQDVIER